MGEPPVHEASLALVRFQLDEDLPPAIAAIAREQGIDVIASSECNRNGLTDHAQLRLAAIDERCLVTRNRDDFIRLTEQFYAKQAAHAGVLIVSRSLPNRDAARIAQALVAYAHRHEKDFAAYLVDFLAASVLA